MRYKLFGRSGLRVSELCLGTMTFGKSGPRGTPPAECEAIFREFVKRGGNFVDLAAGYGDGRAEAIVRDLIGARRAHFVLSTRLSVPEGFTDVAARMRLALEGALRRLRTDHLDLLWLDGWTNRTAFDAVMESIETMVCDGKVLYVGVADAPTWVVSQGNLLAGLNRWTPFVGLQCEFSLLERRADQEALPVAEALGLSTAPRSVLAGGLLTCKYRHEELAPFLSERNQLIVEQLRDVARDLGRPPAQVALNWVRQQGAKLVPILGARTAAQLVETLGCLDFTLTSTLLSRLACDGVASHAAAAFPSSAAPRELASA